MQNDRLMCAPKPTKVAPTSPKQKLVIALGTVAVFAVCIGGAIYTHCKSDNEFAESVIVIDKESALHLLAEEGWKADAIKKELDSVISRFADAGLLVLDKTNVIAAPASFSPDITAAVRLKLARNPDNRIPKENLTEALTNRNGRKVLDKAEALWKAAGF